MFCARCVCVCVGSHCPQSACCEPVTNCTTRPSKTNWTLCKKKQNKQTVQSGHLAAAAAANKLRVCFCNFLSVAVKMRPCTRLLLRQVSSSSSLSSSFFCATCLGVCHFLLKPCNLILSSSINHLLLLVRLILIFSQTVLFFPS